jgi:hypothetical protein
MGYVDDATGQVFGRFYEYEGVYSAMDSLKRYVSWYGIPMSLYLDKHSTYKTTRRPDLEEELRGHQAQTQFERACKELGIQVIHAHSPQAKGRIERAFGTLQDRLIKEMRLRSISSKEEANRFLSRYLRSYNRRFAKEALKSGDLHRPLSKEVDLKKIFCIKATRTINEGYTVRWKGRLFLIESVSVMMRRKKVLVREHFNGKIILEWKGQKLKYREVTEQVPKRRKEMAKISQITSKRRKEKYKPAPTHPWKRHEPALHHYVIKGNMVYD